MLFALGDFCFDVDVDWDYVVFKVFLDVAVLEF